jgi:hypothetical protein
VLKPADGNAESSSCSSIQEREEPKNTHTAQGAEPSDPKPDQPSSKDKEARRTGLVPAGWEPSGDEWVELNAVFGGKFPDLADELRQFINWAQSKGQEFSSVTAGFRRWLDTGGSGRFPVRNGARGSKPSMATSDRKMHESADLMEKICAEQGTPFDREAFLNTPLFSGDTTAFTQKPYIDGEVLSITEDGEGVA